MLLVLFMTYLLGETKKKDKNIGKKLMVRMTPPMSKVLREPDFSIALLAG